jgi:flavin reductase (NADH)/flavin reductase
MQVPAGNTIDPASFKAGMRHLAGGVCLITSVMPDGRRAGLTATAVCSVSAVPAMLLVCVNRATRSHDVMLDSGVFAVNVLDVLDQGLARRFAGGAEGDARFDGASWTQLHSGAPVLESALASFDCRIAQAMDVGSHRIIFGAVQAVRLGPPEGRPLLYAHGSYGGFTAWQAAPGMAPGPEEDWL